jgi:hypothetical protein
LSTTPVVKKKVKAYPIPVQITATGAPFRGEIIKLVKKGFICNLMKHVIQVNDVLQVVFELPVIRHVITSPAIVIKTYDRTTVTAEIERLAEVHFTQLNDKDVGSILAFIRAIKQADE